MLHGVRIDGNEQFAVYAINRYGGFVITYKCFKPSIEALKKVESLTLNV